MNCLLPFSVLSLTLVFSAPAVHAFECRKGARIAGIYRDTVIYDASSDRPVINIKLNDKNTLRKLGYVTRCGNKYFEVNFSGRLVKGREVDFAFSGGGSTRPELLEGCDQIGAAGARC